MEAIDYCINQLLAIVEHQVEQFGCSAASAVVEAEGHGTKLVEGLDKGDSDEVHIDRSD